MNEIGFKTEAEAKATVKGNLGYVNVGGGTYTFEILSTQKLASPGTLPFYNTTRRMIPMRIGDFEFIPMGDNNRMPDELREMLDENNITTGVLEKSVGLIWGQGPALYDERFEAGKRLRFWDADPEIETWLKSWDYEEYLMKALVEFKTMNGHFTKYYRNLGSRIGLPGMIVKLEHCSCLYARLGWPDFKNGVTNIIAGDFDRPWINGLASYPVFNSKAPFAFPVAMSYDNFYNFALDKNYSRPSFYGNINWMKLSNTIPKLLNAFNLNSASIKYHIKSPSAFWERKEQQLREKCLDAVPTIEYTDKMLDDLKEEILSDYSKSLCGIDNVGKIMHTEKIYEDSYAEFADWTVEVLDQKVKDFIDAQINISKHANLNTNAGLGLHPALSGLSDDGNLPSGSEQLYAFKFYLLTSTDIAESIICKALNFAIQANFPKTTKRIGFYHDTIITEEQTSPKERVKNK